MTITISIENGVAQVSPVVTPRFRNQSQSTPGRVTLAIRGDEAAAYEAAA